MTSYKKWAAAGIALSVVGVLSGCGNANNSTGGTAVTNTTKYETVLQGMNDKTFSKVKHKFQEWKVPYKVVGASIEVPATQIDQVRIKLAEAGLPKKGTVQSNAKK